MSVNVKIEVSPENQQKVIDSIAGVIKADGFSLKPIVGKHDDLPNTIFLIYEGVKNGPEVAIAAMCSGAAMASFM